MKERMSILSSARVERSIRYRFNPLSQLSPEYLVQAHNEFRAGGLRNAALLWDEMEDSDDILKAVAPKRKKSVSRHGIEVNPIDDSKRAKQHAATLETFWGNIVATSALDRNERGGVPMLIRQMQDAVGKKYSVHEKLWRYRDGVFSAEFVHVPLWFFENRTGRLRYLAEDYAMTGQELKESDWMITTGEGVMRACAICYMFKHLSQNDRLIYSEKWGFPVSIGKSEGKPGDDVWDQMEDAIADLSGGDSIVISENASIELKEVGASGDHPAKQIIDDARRAMTILWMGADLSTISASDSVGASVQREDQDAMEEDDAANISDVLQEQVDRWVIKYVHGDSTPLAWSSIKGANTEDVNLDLTIDKGLNEIGYEDDVQELADRYGRAKLRKRERLSTDSTDLHRLGTESAANEDPGPSDKYIQRVSDLYIKALAADTRPLAERLAALLVIEDEGELTDAITELEKDFPEIAGQVLDADASVQVLDDAQSAAMRRNGK